MDFRIEQALDGAPDAVEDVLLDPAFITARAALPKLGDAELLERSRDGHHAVQHVRLRFTAPLASAVTAVIDPDRLTWVDEARYDLRTRVAEHTIIPDHYGDRLQCSYRATITPADEASGGGSTRVLTGTVKVRMPLVGGKVERAIVSGVDDSGVVGAESELRSPRKPRRRNELETTKTDENPIAAAAMTGFSKPAAASGIAATL